MRLVSIASGSSGNCIYIGNDNTHLLVDVGISAKRIEAGLKEIDLCGRDIDGILITHEHSDHVKGIKVFTKKHKSRLIMTQGTYEALSESDALENVDECCVITSGGADIGCMCVKSFSTSHDSKEPCGYTVELANGRKIAVATDLGIMTDTVFDAIKGSDLVMLESNHDVNMLQCGGYPYILKRRILGVKGHLSKGFHEKMLQYAMSIGMQGLGYLEVCLRKTSINISNDVFPLYNKFMAFMLNKVNY